MEASSPFEHLDPYVVLGVERSATAGDIKSACKPRCTAECGLAALFAIYWKKHLRALFVCSYTWPYKHLCSVTAGMQLPGLHASGSSSTCCSSLLATVHHLWRAGRTSSVSLIVHVQTGGRPCACTPTSTMGTSRPRRPLRRSSGSSAGPMLFCRTPTSAGATTQVAAPVTAARLVCCPMKEAARG